MNSKENALIVNKV